jgi:transposase-like protein
MYSYEDRIRAVTLYIKLGKRTGATIRQLGAYFSDRGRRNQADRGRRFSAIVDAHGMRASEVFNVSQSTTINLKRACAKRLTMGFASGVVQTYPRRRTALATYRPTRWVSRFAAHGYARRALRSLQG